MELYCTRPSCSRPGNSCPDLDDPNLLKRVPHKFCTACGMPLILAGRYLPERLLGQGGFGAAFLARDRYLPGLRACVVKQFQPAGSLTPQQLQIAKSLFEREAEALEHVGNPHPQIPDLYAFFSLTVPGMGAAAEEEYFFLVQEFIDGQDLDEILAQQGSLSEAEVRAILAAILPVLQFIHDRQMIHRDIKPSNIMRHRNGEYYLLDFGAVKQATKGSQRSTGIYSAGFAPPEQMAGGQVFPATDLYALAVTALMLLTGKQPEDLYDGFKNTWAWRSHAPQVSDALATVLDRMLRPTPSDRFPTAAAVLSALQPSASVPPAAAAPSSVVPPPVPPAPVATPATQPPPPGPLPQPAPSAPRPAAPPAAAAQPPPAKAPRPARRQRPPLSLRAQILGAMFTGFESTLLAIALFSLPLNPILSAGGWLLLSAMLVWVQWQRWIEGWDRPIIAVVTLGLVLWIGPLHAAITAFAQNPMLTVVILAGLVGLALTTVTILFNLIYRLLRLFL